MLFMIAGLIGYLFGCLHGSQVVGKIKGIDIKEHGVKNSGASNATIVLGWKYGIFVALIDISKAIFAILLVILVIDGSTITQDQQFFYIFVTALFTIVGHNYPVTMKFQGGKGTASFIGALLIIDWKLALFGIGILLLLSFATGYLVVGVIFMYVFFLITSYIFYGFYPAGIIFLLLILCIWKHLENFRRIIDGSEKRISSVIGRRAI